jgi:hypothetical protein
MVDTKRTRRIGVAFLLSTLAFLGATTILVTGDRGMVQWLSMASTFSSVIVFGILQRVELRKD